MITARPSYARIKTALLAIRDHPDLELQLVVGASALLDRYGSAIHAIRADGFEPDATVYMVVEGENLVTSAKSTGVGIIELATIFDNLRPDAIVSVADRYETIATAIAGSYMNIPVAHVQGGEVTGSVDEKVRHAVTKLANLHFVASDGAAERVRRMGEDPATVHVTGCPSIDLAVRVREGGGALRLSDLRKGVGADVGAEDDYLVVAQHPVTNEWLEAERQMTETLWAVAELGVQTFWFWPNVDAGADASSRAIRKFRENHGSGLIRFFKNLSPEAFLELLMGAKCLIGNSSTGIREGSFLGVPTVNVGTRQQGRERGSNVVDVDYDRRAILRAATGQISHGPYPSSAVYGDGRAGERIARHLAEADLRIEKMIQY